MSISIEVVGGGEPSDEELAALSIAVEVLVAEDAVREPRATPGWVIAGLHEAVGGQTVSSPPMPTGPAS